jgi:hypothetical protein
MMIMKCIQKEVGCEKTRGKGWKEEEREKETTKFVTIKTCPEMLAKIEIS